MAGLVQHLELPRDHRDGEDRLEPPVPDGARLLGVPKHELGVGGAIGHREIVNANPDGQTIGMFSNGGIALPYLNPQANTNDELRMKLVQLIEEEKQNPK